MSCWKEPSARRRTGLATEPARLSCKGRGRESRARFPSGRTPLQGDRQPGMARAWQALIGDGGWAGVLAESFLADPRRTVFLVFRPGMDLLPLFVEALALLPASRRWDVDFSTYFNQLPQGVSCTWRGVLDGSDEVKNAGRLPNALVLDLCRALGHARGSARSSTWRGPGSGSHRSQVRRPPRREAGGIFRECRRKRRTSAADLPGQTWRDIGLGAREGVMNCFRNWRGSVPGAGLPAPAETSGPNRRQRKLHWVLVVVSDLGQRYSSGICRLLSRCGRREKTPGLEPRNRRAAHSE